MMETKVQALKEYEQHELDARGVISKVTDANDAHTKFIVEMLGSFSKKDDAVRDPVLANGELDRLTYKAEHLYDSFMQDLDDWPERVVEKRSDYETQQERAEEQMMAKMKKLMLTNEQMAAEHETAMALIKQELA
jgi:hypothetical protein